MTRDKVKHPTKHKQEIEVAAALQWGPWVWSGWLWVNLTLGRGGSDSGPHGELLERFGGNLLAAIFPSFLLASMCNLLRAALIWQATVRLARPLKASSLDVHAHAALGDPSSAKEGIYVTFCLVYNRKLLCAAPIQQCSSFARPPRWEVKG